jgi:drug/metabolite transporter (DMT)-like permease
VGIKLYIMMLIMLISGSANTIIYKVQDGTDAIAPKSGYPNAVPFNQPFWQCAVMFVGELLCLGVYGIKTYMNRGNSKINEGNAELMGRVIPTKGRLNADGKPIKTNINPLLLAIPAACDTIGSTLMNIALTMVPASIYQMMRGIVVIITAGMARVFL